VENPSTRSARWFLPLSGLLAALLAGPAPSFAEPPITSAPRPLARAHPVYPRAALQRGVEGSVLLEFKVDEHGNVIRPRVLESRPRGVFDSAALEALKQWKYEAVGAETDPIQVRLTFRNGR
jgi:TonB family protein